MSDPTISKFRQRISEIRAESQRLRARLGRAAERLQELEKEEQVLSEALRLIGAEVPEIEQSEIAAAGARRRKRKGIRAIDAALQVVKPGEEINKRVVAQRVVDQGIQFESANLPNALATAMGRSPQFKNLGRGIFKRREPEEQHAAEEGGLGFN